MQYTFQAQSPKLRLQTCLALRSVGPKIFPRIGADPATVQPFGGRRNSCSSCCGSGWATGTDFIFLLICTNLGLGRGIVNCQGWPEDIWGGIAVGFFACGDVRYVPKSRGQLKIKKVSEILFRRHQPFPRTSQGELNADCGRQKNVELPGLNFLQVAGADARQFCQFILG